MKEGRKEGFKGLLHLVDRNLLYFQKSINSPKKFYSNKLVPFYTLKKLQLYLKMTLNNSMQIKPEYH